MYVDAPHAADRRDLHDDVVTPVASAELATAIALADRGKRARESGLREHVRRKPAGERALAQCAEGIDLACRGTRQRQQRQRQHHETDQYFEQREPASAISAHETPPCSA